MEQFLPLILIGGFAYLVLILPQQRRARAHRELLASLEVGDEVLLSSGIHGFVSAVDSAVVWVEVAADVELKVAKSAITDKIVEADKPDGSEDTVEDSTESDGD